MNTFIEEFLNWEAMVKQDVDHVKQILSINLSDEPETLIRDMEDAEVWNARVGFLLADANSWLDKARKVYRMDKEEGRTEGDRKAFVDEAVADIRKFRDYCEVLVDSIKQRLILGESVLGYYRQFKTNQNVQNGPTAPQNINRGEDAPF